MPKIILKWIGEENFNKETGVQEVMGMTNKRGCRFFQDPESLHFGRGIGYCDLGVIWSICDGDVGFCESPDAMIKSLCEEWKRGTERPVSYSHP